MRKIMNAVVKKIISAFEELGLYVVCIAEYGNGRFLVRALHDLSREDEIDTWYGYSVDGQITSYSPIPELDKFDRVTSNNVIYRRNEK